MKTFRHLSLFLGAATLCAAALNSSAQLTVSVTNTFANNNNSTTITANSASTWEYWFGSVGYTGNLPMTNAPSTNDPNSSTSGALVVALPWTGTAQQQYMFGDWSENGQGDTTLKMTAAYITNISFDVFVAPSSPLNSSGNFGTLQVGLDGASGFAGNFTIPSSASNGWVHVSIPAHVTGMVSGPEIYMQTTSSNLLTGTSLIYLANLQTTASPNYTNNFTNTPGSQYGGSANIGCSSSSWIYSNGVNTANAAMSWCSNVNASGTSAPGSLLVSIPWTNASGNSTGANLIQTMFGTFAGRSAKDNGETTTGSNFQNIYCSVLVSNTSPMNAAGNYGVLQIGFVTYSNNNWHGITWPASAVTLNASASTGWTNFVVPIDYTAAGLSNVSGIFLEMQTGAAQGGGLPGTTQLFVDNLGLNPAVPNPSNISVTVQSSPLGCSFTVDGTLYTTSQTFAWISNSSHTIATTSTQSGGTGIQNLWSSWSDAGAISHTISPAVATIYTANFTTQYYLTMNAGAGGGVNPASGWNNSGAVVPIGATANGGYSFGSWTGSGSGSYSGSSASPSVTMNAPITETASFIPNIAVTVQSSQPGCSFTVDGTNFITPQLFSWIPGSGHVIATTSLQSGSTGTQYLWSNWSDAGAISHTVSPTVGTTYTANFTTQYYLTMNAGTGGGVNPGSAWYNSGAVVPMSAPASSGYSFSSWTGSGSGSYSGASASPSVTMNGPISEMASFGANISVTVQTSPLGCTFTVDGTAYTNNGTFGWLPGTAHTIATTSPQGGGAGIQYLWTNWSDGGAISHEISPASDTAYTVNFTTQYYLTMNADTGGGVSPASGWNDSNAVVAISATPNAGCAFSSWTGLGADSYSGSINAASVTMNEPMTETASFMATAGPSFTCVSQSGANLVFNGLNPMSTSDMNCVVLSSLDLSLPLAQWTPVATNQFNCDGTFCFTNAINPSQPAMYYAFMPCISVTVQATQPGCAFTVDGTTYTASQSFSWASNSTHVIATTSPQSGSTGIQYVWGSWSDAGAISHAVSPAHGAAYTANFTTQYYLAMNASAGGSVSPASGWDNSGAVVPIVATANDGFSFIGWTGLGADSYSGTGVSPSVTMNEPITETASFAPNISVTVQANLPGCSFSVDGSNFTTSQTFSWTSNSTHTIATASPQSGGTGIRYVWSNWSDGGATSHVVNPAVGTTYTASFTTQYYLTMNAGTGGNVSPASVWTNSGAVVSISATPTGGYNFTSWNGTGSGSYSGSSGSTSVTMNGPITETASFAPNNLPAVASFTMSTNLGVAPFTVTFSDTSLNSPASWNWTFGDGGASTLQNPSHTFTNMWRQTVSLTVSNVNGHSSSNQAVYQCFPCDALYDWTGGTQGQVAQIASLGNSLVAGGNNIGHFTTTNGDLPSPNLQGIIFTNLPGMTNGCPVVFSNGVINANFNTTNALAYCWTNDHEQYDFQFNSSLVVTNLVLVFYDSMPLSSNTWSSCVDELNIATAKDNPDLGSVCLNRNLGCNGPWAGYANNYHTSETCNPTYYGQTTGWTSTYFDGSRMYELPNKMYRILLQYNTNTEFVCAIADPVTSTMVGFVTNYDSSYAGSLIKAYANGHTSWEVYTNNGLGQASLATDTSILACHSVISINRRLTWSQASNVVMYGP